VPWTQSYIWQLRLQLTFRDSQGFLTYYEVDWLSCGKVAVAGETILLEQAAEVWADPIHGLAGQYTVKIDNGGYVSGFGLSSEAAINEAPRSSFVVRADKFAVGPAAGPTWSPTKAYVVGDTVTWATQEIQNGPWVKHVYQCILAHTNQAPTITTYWEMLDGELPFIVTTNNSTYTQEDGSVITIGPGVYMNRTFIHDAFIDSAMIGNAAITTAKIADASIVNAKIANATIGYAKIQSVDANTITVNKITAGQIETQDLIIKDEFGNLILGAGVRLPTGQITGLGQWATLQGPITSLNITTLIANAAINELYIANVLQSIPPMTATTGWRIEKTGNVTFNQLTARGTMQSNTFVANTNTGWEIQADGDATFNNVLIYGGLIVRDPLPDAHGPFILPFGTGWSGGTFYHNTGKIPMVAAQSENPDYAVSISSIGATSFQITIVPTPTTSGTAWVTYW
jgi:hypothetical protein